MRELRFRAWDGDRMQRVLTLGINEGFVSTDKISSDIDDFVIMQYTGRKDINGKEIYEGDIVQFQHDTSFKRGGFSRNTFKAPIIYEGFEEYGYASYVYKFKDFLDSNCTSFLNGRSKEELEVVGNIYENPELLGEN
jgi:uncharacterized phage protein (TIGR01671 family)